MKLPQALENILFLDIETVPEAKNFGQLNREAQDLYAAKTEYKRKATEISAEDYYDHAGIWAEFGKIVCISVGYVTTTTNGRQFRVRSFFGDEKQLLVDFKILLDKHFSSTQNKLCAHNGKEFDFPFIARRMLKHKLELPILLQMMGKKPWEVPHIDTLELWKFGDYKHYTSLKLMTNVLGIPSPKDDIDGSEIYRVFYEENDLKRIITYCEKDTLAVAQILLRLRGAPLLEKNEIAYI